LLNKENVAKDFANRAREVEREQETHEEAQDERQNQIE